MQDLSSLLLGLCPRRGRSAPGAFALQPSRNPSLLSLLCPLLPSWLPAARFPNPPSLLLLLVLTLKHCWVILHCLCSGVLLISLGFQCLTCCSGVFPTPPCSHIDVKCCCSLSPAHPPQSQLCSRLPEQQESPTTAALLELGTQQRDKHTEFTLR